MQKTSIALYMDLENLPRGVDLDLLLAGLGQDDPQCIYSVKAAYGAVSQISTALRDRLAEHGIRLVDAPHLTGKKNRADLMISIDAFERFHVNVPPVDRYVFVTSDSDFSVIMDRLRSYGKQVWMVCRKDDRHKKLLLHSCDRLLFIEDFFPSPQADPRTAQARERAENLLKETLIQIGRNGLPVNLAIVGAKMRNIDASFTVRGSGFKSLSALVRQMEADNLLRTGCDEKGSPQIEDVDDSRLRPASEIPSQNLARRGGQAHFAPKTPQNEPVPDGFGIGPEWPDSAPALPPVIVKEKNLQKSADAVRSSEVKLLWPLEEPLLDVASSD